MKDKLFRFFIVPGLLWIDLFAWLFNATIYVGALVDEDEP